MEEKKPYYDNNQAELDAMNCPISLENILDIKNPVRTFSEHIYEKEDLKTWIQRSPIDPMTRKPLTEKDIKEVSQETKVLIGAIRELKVKNDEQEKKSLETDKKFEMVFKALEQVQFQNNNLIVQNNNLTAQVTQLTTQVTQLTAQVTQLRDEKNQLTDRVTTLESENNKLTNKVNTLEKENTALATQNSRLLCGIGTVATISATAIAAGVVKFNIPPVASLGIFSTAKTNLNTGIESINTPNAYSLSNSVSNFDRR